MKNYLILFIGIFFSINAFATHSRAGEILYKRIAPFTKVVNTGTVQVYTYSITVIKYTNHGTSVADRCEDTVYFGDGQNGIALRINGTNTCSCASYACGLIIVNNPNYIVKQNVYTITPTYAGPGTYIIRSSDPFRNSSVHNIPNSSNTPFILEAGIIISSTSGANTSPKFSFAPIDVATINNCFTHNPGGIDVDGDSLSYEVIPCLAAGYFDPEGTYGINSITGLMTWCTPQFISEYNVAFRVKEWRKNSSGMYEVIGWIMRDMQILVYYSSVGLINEHIEDEFDIYPNPGSDKVQLKLSTQTATESECQIYNLAGELVSIQKINTRVANSELDISSLQSGLYFLQINCNKAVLRKKLIKK